MAEVTRPSRLDFLGLVSQLPRCFAVDMNLQHFALLRIRQGTIAQREGGRFLLQRLELQTAMCC